MAENNTIEDEESVSFLPQSDVEYLNMKGFDYKQVKDDKDRCLLIIDNYLLPDKMYKCETVKLLVLIPKLYNDAAPDMFFCIPFLELTSTGKEPAATNGRVDFDGMKWQQWSRHSNTGNDWRPGIDGIRSHLQKVNEALKKG